MKLSLTLLRRYRFRNVHQPAPELTSGIGKYTKSYANLPERYLVRKTAKVLQKSEDHPAYVPRLNKWSAQYHGLERPWTEYYWRDTGAFNPDRHPDIVQPISEEDWMWFRGDRVEVMTGDDKGKQGHILYVVQERNWVIVQGLNCTYDTEMKEKDFPGVMTMKEKPLLVTKDIKLVDPEDTQPCECQWKFDENGDRVRVSQRTGKVIPIPTQAFETIDYKTQSSYKEDKAKDTMPDVVEETTFQPKLATFEMDIMNSYDIKEHKVPRKTFWY